MDSATRRLKIQNLKAQIELFRLQGIYFAKQFEESSTFEQKAVVAQEWDDVMKGMREMQIALDLLEKQEEEAKPN